MIKDSIGNEALWHNQQWMVLENSIEEIRDDGYQEIAYYYYRKDIQTNPSRAFDHIARKNWVDENQLYECFKKAQELWGQS